MLFHVSSSREDPASTSNQRSITRLSLPHPSFALSHIRHRFPLTNHHQQLHQQHPRSHLGANGKEDGDAEELPVVYRWTPIVSGILCPFSIMMEIPGLTDHWYVKTVDNVPVVYQNNPTILNVALGFSMSFAVLANIALIMRFLEHRPRTSTLIAIFFLTLHDILNIISLIWFAIIHAVDDGFTYGQSFYLVLVSTVISLIVNGSLIIDAYLFFRSAKGSGLTERQRGLVVCFMVWLIWLSFGAGCNVQILKISFQDSLYYTLTTIGTTGFGDFHPTTTLGKVFSIFYDSVGIVMLAVLVASTRETVIEGFEKSYRSRRERILRKARERREVKERRWFRERFGRVKDHHHRHRHRHRHSHSHDHENTVEKGKGKDGGEPVEWEAPYAIREEEERVREETAGLFSRLFRRVRKHAQHLPQPLERLRKVGTGSESEKEQELAFKRFRREMEDEEMEEYLTKIGLSVLLFFFFWVVGTIVFHFTERWNWFDSFWFCYVTFSTIGYGDFTPTTPAGRAFFIAWAIFGISTLTILFSVCAEAWSARFKHSLRSASMRRAFHKFQSSRPDSPVSSSPSNQDHPAAANSRHPAYEMHILASKLKESFKHLSSSERREENGSGSSSSALPQKIVEVAPILQRLKTDPVAVDMLEKDVELLSGGDAEEKEKIERVLFWANAEKHFEDLVKFSEECIRIARETEHFFAVLQDGLMDEPMEREGAREGTEEEDEETIIGGSPLASNSLPVSSEKEKEKTTTEFRQFSTEERVQYVQEASKRLKEILDSRPPPAAPGQEAEEEQSLPPPALVSPDSLPPEPGRMRTSVSFIEPKWDEKSQ
ncbi:voltage-gated potassium channel [Atractiella rhizophila]|nr:voltage-gated potassium channel [Atractiella rhizophila]